MGALTTALAVVVSATLGGTASARLSMAAAGVKCGKSVTIGVAYPATGNAASIGVTQWDWANWAKQQWNKTHALKIALIPGDTKLATDASANLAVAHTFSSNGKILAVTGPAGSQEVEDATGIYESHGLANVSGSATRVELTRGLISAGGHPRFTDPGFFFRTVPNDGQQGDKVAYWMAKKANAKRIYIIDDEESYSQGLATQVTKDLKSKYGITVTGTNHVTQTLPQDFTSVIASIPANTQIVYTPWQEPAEAQSFYQQYHTARPSTTTIQFGSDGTDDPSTFTGAGSLVSGFPVDLTSKSLKSFATAHSGNQELFGLPSYTSVWVNATAIQMACTAGHGTTTRTAVRKDLYKVNLTSAQSLLGFPVKFLTKNAGAFQGNGDMGGTADFAVYQIQGNGSYKRLG
jgi:ABC-type branched-subunit amino acid transport system substrate-binding protein